MMKRLAADPWSMWRADELEDVNYFGYTPEAQRLDSVIDAVNMIPYALVKVNAGKKKHIPAPEPVARPGDDQKNTESPTSLDDVGAFFM